MSALDFPAIAAALGMRGTCTIHLVNPVEQDVERPADRSDGALCVTLSETVRHGPVRMAWSDSPPRAILTVTHRASGLCLSSIAGPWLANKEGLRLAKMAAKVLRKAPGINWTLKDPDRGADMKLLIALRELVAVNVPLPKPKRTRKAWPPDP